MRVAILDDYQQVSLASADWSAVRSLGQIDVFAEHIGRTEALVSALEPYDVVVAMRERTPFDADLLGQLPRLRLLVTTGMGNTSIDLEAAAARGITVSGTGGIGTATALRLAREGANVVVGSVRILASALIVLPSSSSGT